MKAFPSVALAVTIGCLPYQDVTFAGDLANIELVQTKIVDLPFIPADLKTPPDGTKRLFALGVSGEIRIIDLETNTVSPTPFMQVPNIQFNSGERAAYSIAFHPDFATNGYFYVHHSVAVDFQTGGRTGSRVVRFTADSPTTGNPSSNLTIYETIKFVDFHYGGTIEFGPDGYLYMGFGDDEGIGGDPQNGYSPHGHILRIDVDNPSNGKNYGIPAGNPFQNFEGIPEVLMGGLRNPWKFSFDRDTGDFWVADVGEDNWEEISLISGSVFENPETPPDFGWPYYEGNSVFDTTGTAYFPSIPENPIAPVYVYDHTGAFTPRSVTGGYVYRGSRFPRMQGVYFFGDYMTTTLSGLENSDGWMARDLADYENHENLTTFGEGPDGELYMAISLSIYHLGDTLENSGTPEVLQVVDVGVDGSDHFFIGVLGTEGGSLQLRRRDGLDGGLWTDVGLAVPATSGKVILSDTEETVPADGFPHRFYQVVQTLP